jgi:cation diffusion facilitator family transporter
VSLVVGCLAVYFTYRSSSQAILLDGVFNLAYFFTGLFTIRVARLLREPEDEEFPFGFAYFEPLMNGIKGCLVLGVSIFALIEALRALASGGRPITAGAAIIYALIASCACWFAYLGTRTAAVRSQSPLVKADSRNWMVNAVISTAVMLAFLSTILIRKVGADYLLPYVDPVLVVALVVITIWIPLRQTWQALMEILNRAPSREVRSRVRSVVASQLGDLPVQRLYVRVVQPGRTRYVSTHVVLPPDYALPGLSALDEIRARTWEALQPDHPGTFLDMVFTAEERWAVDKEQGGRAAGSA